MEQSVNKVTYMKEDDLVSLDQHIRTSLLAEVWNFETLIMIFFEFLIKKNFS